MKKHLSKLLLLGVVAFFFVSCVEEEDFFEQDYPTTSFKTTVVENVSTVLGRKLPNPYSVTNMTNALNNLRTEYGMEPNIEIEPTDYYVRFLPQDLSQYDKLTSDTNLLLFDYPLDYEIITLGDYYHDPSIPDTCYTWQYATVPIDYVFNNEIRYEILDTCYIPDDTDESQITDYDILEQNSFFILGLREYVLENKDIQTRALWGNGKKPEGYYKVYNTEDCVYEPVKQARAVCHTIVKNTSATINYSNGYYKMNKKFSTNLYYKIKWSNPKGFRLHYPITVAVSNFGVHGKSGYSKNIDFATNAGRLATINNAATEYYNICSNTNILPPPSDLKIFFTGDSWGSSAPMLTRVIHPILFNGNNPWYAFFENLFLSPFLGTAQSICSLIGPDITILSSTLSSRIFRSVWHELSHASHFAKVGSQYWSEYISYIITFDTYGEITDNNSGVCGVGEMWASAATAHYMKIYKNITIGVPDDWYKPEILRDLMRDNILTNTQIFNCLNSDIRSHQQLKVALKNAYPEKSRIIESKFNQYGF
jgi:hypothetical protein